MNPRLAHLLDAALHLASACVAIQKAGSPTLRGYSLALLKRVHAEAKAERAKIPS